MQRVFGKGMVFGLDLFVIIINKLVIVTAGHENSISAKILCRGRCEATRRVDNYNSRKQNNCNSL